MSIFSAFRSVAVEILHLNTRSPTPWLLRSTPCQASSHGLSTLPRTLRRSFHASHSHRKWVKNSQSSKVEETPEERKAKELKRREIGLRDYDIPYAKVRVSTPEGLSPFRTLADVCREVEHLNSLEGKHTPYHAQLIANEPTPIVKIIDFRAEYKKHKEAREKAKNNAAQKVRKEFQLTWSSSEADVETKLGKMREDLEKGYKVDLAIMSKKGMRPPSLEDMEGRVQEFVDHFSDIAKEWKGRDFTKATAVVYLQGTATPSVEAKETTSVPEKIRLKEQRKQKADERLRRKQEQEARLQEQFSVYHLESS